MFIPRPFSYNIMYLSRSTTSYSCTSSMMPEWSYYQWFGYSFVTLFVWEWTHYNPWYISKYCCSYCIGEWSSRTKRGFSPFSSPHTKTNGYCHHQKQFSNLGRIVIANPTCIDLVQHVLMMTTHSAKVIAQDKARSYTKQTPGNDFIPLAIKTYNCLHLYFDSFLTSCVHANIARHQ